MSDMNGELVPGIGNEVVWTFFFLFILGVGLMTVSRRPLLAMYQRSEAFLRYHIYGEPYLERGGADREVPAENVHQPAPYNNGVCPICLNEHQLPLETNCGHVFCGNCIRSYYDNGAFFTSGMLCPLCRQTITMFFICFTTNELTEQNPQLVIERERIVGLVRSYNDRFSGAPRPLMSYLRDMPTLMRHLWNEFFTVGGLVYMFRIRIVMCFMAGIVYLFSPLDIVPEAVFGILGLLDDLFVLFLLAMYHCSEFQLIWRNNKTCGVGSDQT